MQNTTYYNLNIVEGTDIVNPLTVDNPNFEKIDEEMHKNAVSGVTLATEIANATVHSINRENSECSVIRFIATSNWKVGDTVTVDGVPVTALLPSGETLPDGAYVINANVLCILTGSNLTVYVERKKIDNAAEIIYNNTNVADELTALNRDLNNKDTYILNSALIESTLHIRGNIGIIEFNNTFKVGLGSAEWVGMAKLPDGIRPLSHFVAQIESVSGIQISVQIQPDGIIKMFSRGGIVEGFLVGSIVFPLA